MKFTDTDLAYRYLIEKAESQGMTKKQIANKTGMLPQQVSNNLRNGGVKIKTVRNLGDVLDIKIELSLTDKK